MPQPLVTTPNTRCPRGFHVNAYQSRLRRIRTCVQPCNRGQGLIPKRLVCQNLTQAQKDAWHFGQVGMPPQLARYWAQRRGQPMTPPATPPAQQQRVVPAAAPAPAPAPAFPGPRVTAYLENRRRNQAATRIQAVVRGRQARVQRQREDAAARRIQAAARNWIYAPINEAVARGDAIRQNRAATRIQALVRGAQARNTLTVRTARAIMQARRARAQRAREDGGVAPMRQMAAAARIQSVARGFLARRQANRMRRRQGRQLVGFVTNPALQCNEGESLIMGAPVQVGLALHDGLGNCFNPRELVSNFLETPNGHLNPANRQPWTRGDLELMQRLFRRAQPPPTLTRVEVNRRGEMREFERPMQGWMRQQHNDLMTNTVRFGNWLRARNAPPDDDDDDLNDPGFQAWLMGGRR